MSKPQIGIDELLTIIGAKEVDLFIANKKIAVLEGVIKELSAKKEEAPPDGAGHPPG